MVDEVVVAVDLAEAEAVDGVVEVEVASEAEAGAEDSERSDATTSQRETLRISHE